MARAELIRLAGKIPILSTLLRSWAHRYAEGSVVTIASGQAKGLQWKRFHRYVNGYWLGLYELEMQQAVVDHLKPGQRFFDMGANAGFFSLIGARVVGSQGACVSFDPDPANLESIQAQQELNGYAHWKAMACAISGRNGRLKFSLDRPGSPTARLDSESGTGTEIDAITLDEACKAQGAPNLIKMDIEGAELSVLQAAPMTLKDVRPTFLIELHGPEAAAGVRKLLKEARYRIFTISGEEVQVREDTQYHILAKPE